MINELVKFIKEYLPFIVLNKHISIIEKYDELVLLYDLPSLDIPCKNYFLPKITFFISK